MALEPYLITLLYSWMLAFCRIGGAVMLLPGFGERFVSLRARLLFALVFATVVAPMATFPPVPDSPLGLFVLVAGEITVGVFLGSVARVIISAMHTAGMIVAFQSSLAAAMMFDVSQDSQGSAVGNLFGVLGVTLLFTTDLHHIMLAGVAESYAVLPSGAPLPLGDMANSIARLVADMFVIAFQIASPVVAVTMVLYLGGGILARLMPTMQVFFVLIPGQILLAFMVLSVTIGSAMLWFLRFADQNMAQYMLFSGSP